MTHAKRCAGDIEANIRKIAYSGYTDIQGSKIITEITAIIQQAIDDSQSQQIAELKGENERLRSLVIVGRTLATDPHAVDIPVFLRNVRHALSQPKTEES